jgi:phospholipase A1
MTPRDGLPRSPTSRLVGPARGRSSAAAVVSAAALAAFMCSAQLARSEAPIPDNGTFPPPDTVPNACLAGPGKPLDPLEPYKDNYLLPWTHDGVRSADRMADEAKFQISVRKELFRCAPLHVYMAYTQRSLWQVYDQTNSRPFRATDYNPELFLELHGESDASRPSLFRVGLEHESNGQSDPFSRSWNRIYAQPGWGSLRAEGVTFKLWWRIPEPRKASPADTSGDDNPDIQDYLGVAELNAWWTHSLGDRWEVLFRRGYRDGSETVRLDWDVPIGFLGSGVAFRIELFSGYGETLIDYNRRISRFGLGIVFR